MIRSSCNGRMEKRVVMSCVDDANFYTSGEEHEKKIQDMKNHHTKTHEATGGKV